MTRRLWSFIAALLLLATNAAQAGTVIDRIVATVNGHIILQSDWDDALSYEALSGGKSAEQLFAADRNAVLNRLIDQELLREQIRTTDAYAPKDETVSAKFQDIRKQYPGADTDDGWRQILAGYDLSEDEVKSHISMELVILHLVEDRLGSSVQVDDKSIQDYYNQSFLPKLRETGANEVPLAQVAPQIRELVTQQRLNEALADWMQNLRESSTIRLNVNSSANGSQPR
jgi:peptidyl-prolyl cis-trans isomerase SurA